jgi:DinB family protein
MILNTHYVRRQFSMNKQVAMAILVLAIGASGATVAANAQMAAQAKPDQKPTFAMVLDRNLTNVEKEVVGAAEAMPDDKFNFAPTQGEFKGVRTFALQVRHIAVANYMLASGILGEKPPVEIKSENGPDTLTSKADIVKYLRDSFAYAHKAANSIDENNVLGMVQSPFGPNKVTRLSLAIGMISHPFDHYGQMVEYLRMNGIIPPASRGQ